MNVFISESAVFENMREIKCRIVNTPAAFYIDTFIFNETSLSFAHFYGATYGGFDQRFGVKVSLVHFSRNTEAAI